MNEVVQMGRREVAQPATPALPTTAQELVATLAQTIAAMQPDDIQIEIGSVQGVNGSSTRFALRAYRRGEKIFDEEHKR